MSVSTENSELEQRTLAKVSRYMLLYIIVGQFFVQVDRTNISFAQLTMSRELAITATAFGFASGLFALGTFFAQVPSGLAFMKLGARRWLTSIMIAWGLVVMAQAFVTNVNMLYVMRFIIGALEAGYVPGVFVLVSQWFSGRSHGKMIAGLQIGAATSGILGAPFAGWILDQSLFGMSGWKGLFIIEGGLTVVWAIYALRILHNDPARTPWLKPDEREFMSRHLAEYQAKKMADGAVEKTGFLDVLKDFRILALMLAWVLAGWVSSTMAFFMPTMLKVAAGAVSNQTVGLLSMVPFIIMALVEFTWGKHADRTERHWHCVIPLLVSAAGFMLYPFATTAWVAMLAMALVRAGATGFFVTFWPVCNMMVGKNTIAKTTALIETANQIGNFAAPLFFGWAMDRTGSMTLGIYVCVAVLLINFVIMNAFFFVYKARLKRQAAAPATT
jgi:MFS transporter, ACS family, tartrate transporter